MDNRADLIAQLGVLAADQPSAIQREVAAIQHKITYPMKDILAMVPGDSLTERAKRLKVSRQTMYVWLSEKFRPTRVQAKRIARITGVPIEHIVDDGFENDAGRTAHKKAKAVAARRKKAARDHSSTASRRRSKPAAAKRAKSA